MKTHLLSLALLACAATASAQGPLNPPGAPGQTMKSLDQIESRTVIPGGGATYVISTPGSYVLGGNITVATGNGIYITVSNVTLDLNGFTITSTHPTGYGAGIELGSSGITLLTNIRIFNGHVAGGSTFVAATKTFTSSGFVNGISEHTGTELNNVEVCNVTVSGTKQDGLHVTGQSVRDSQVNTSGRFGIAAGTVSGCVAWNTLGTGISGTNVSNCRATSVSQGTDGHGISGENIADSVGIADVGTGILGKTTLNSIGTSVSGIGIKASTAMNCHGTSVSSIGISSPLVSYSYGSSTSGNAIVATSAIGCVVGTGAVSATNKLLGTP